MPGFHMKVHSTPCAPFQLSINRGSEFPHGFTKLVRQSHSFLQENRALISASSQGAAATKRSKAHLSFPPLLSDSHKVHPPGSAPRHPPVPSLLLPPKLTRPRKPLWLPTPFAWLSTMDKRNSSVHSVASAFFSSTLCVWAIHVVVWEPVLVLTAAQYSMVWTDYDLFSELQFKFYGLL